MSFKIIPTGAALGAEIKGVDLTKEIDDTTFEQLKQALYKHEVIFFRGRELSDDDHVRFSARFGKLRLVGSPKGGYVPPHPNIHVVSNVIEDGKYIGTYDAGIVWHTDGSHSKNPHIATLLRAIEVPQKDGHACGATVYASMTAAYDALSAAMKKRIDGLEAIHSQALRDAKSTEAGYERPEATEEQKKKMEVVHPVVRRHPFTGHKCLYVSEGFTVRVVGLPEDESRALLAELTAHCVQPQFLYTHNYQVHDLVMWDDCSTQHKATFDYKLPQRRVMHRTVVLSDSQPGIPLMRDLKTGLIVTPG